MESALGDLNSLTVLTTCVKTGLHRVDLIIFAITSSSPVQSLKGILRQSTPAFARPECGGNVRSIALERQLLREPSGGSGSMRAGRPSVSLRPRAAFQPHRVTFSEADARVPLARYAPLQRRLGGIDISHGKIKESTKAVPAYCLSNTVSAEV
jgi:hypothetical protein